MPEDEKAPQGLILAPEALFNFKRGFLILGSGRDGWPDTCFRSEVWRWR